MRYLLTILFLVFFSLGYAPFANSTQCLPTCSSNDGRFQAIAQINLSTIVGAEIVVNLVSKGDDVKFGNFDVEAEGNWDSVPWDLRYYT